MEIEEGVGRCGLVNERGNEEFSRCKWRGESAHSLDGAHSFHKSVDEQFNGLHDLRQNETQVQCQEAIARG